MANNYRAMCFAAVRGDLDVVRFLLEHGGGHRTQRANRYRAVRLAAFRGHAEVVEALLADSSNQMYLIFHKTIVKYAKKLPCDTHRAKLHSIFQYMHLMPPNGDTVGIISWDEEFVEAEASCNYS